MKELPSFQSVYNKYDGQFELLAIAVDNTANPAELFASKQFTFKGGFDVDGAAKYVTGGIPVTVFIDRYGNKAATKVGLLTEEQFEAELMKLL